MEDSRPLSTEAVDARLSICPQLKPEDMRQAAAAGFRSIINNRPDFESDTPQPTSAQLEAAARAAGLEYRHLPVPPTNHAEADARRMLTAVEGMPQPVLAFCRTGRRSAALYQMGQGLSPEGP